MNKIALVTGGARGLGEQIVRSFLDKGFWLLSTFTKAKKRLKSYLMSLVRMF